jgi:hypothetical protein
MNLTLRFLLVMLLFVGAVGCSGKRTDITGTITRAGKPLEWTDEHDIFLVTFLPEDRKSNGEVYRAETDKKTGTYRIGEIKAGKYVVAIQQFRERHADVLGGKYDPGHSPLRYEVTEDGQVIDIDLP